MNMPTSFNRVTAVIPARKCWVAAILFIMMGAQLGAQTRLGLHVTQEELNVWRQRAAGATATNYVTKGDVQTNSPGDWSRIKANADEFRNSPVTYRWEGPTLLGTAGQVQRLAGDNGTSVRTQNEPNGDKLGNHIRDAAFVYMVDKNNPNRAAYKAAVKDELLALLTIPNTDFSNRTRYPLGYHDDVNPVFMILSWLNNYLFALDYLDAADSEDGVTGTFTATQRDALKSRLLAPALLSVSDQEEAINGLFTDRLSKPDDGAYTTTSSVNGQSLLEYTHLTATGNGKGVYGIHKYFNNRRMVVYRYACLAGLKFGNPTLVAQARRYAKDWLKYSVFPDGTVSEMERWSTLPDLGWGYSAAIISSAITIADALARSGDNSLFAYETTIGKHGTEATAGNEKSLEKCLRLMYQIATKQLTWYGTDVAGNRTANYLIDGKSPVNPSPTDGSWRGLHDVMQVQANLYYKDAQIKSMYLRNGPNMDPYWEYPAQPAKSTVWQGEWGVYSGILFMFGHMEGLVNPYMTVSITAPANNASISAGSAITINATAATNSSGSISKVEFYQGTAKLGEDLSSPYSYTWSGTTAGTYTLTAKATDNSGATRTSDPVTISVGGTGGSTTFYRAINLNGAAVTIDGNAWEASSSAANFSYTGFTFANQNVALNPATDASRTMMIRSSVYATATTPSSVTVSAVPDGQYDVYLYNWEDNSSVTLSFTVEGTVVKSGYPSGPAGTWIKLGPYRVNITDGDLTVSASANGNLSGIEVHKATGSISREKWTGVYGKLVSDIPLSGTPSSTGELTVFETTPEGDYYGSRIRGYIYPPVSGNYTFWVAGDNNCELWLSTDANPANKVKIAFVTDNVSNPSGIAYTSFGQWDKYATQQSAAVSLVAGQQYYVEALHKEDTGGDHLAVGWQLPGGTLERPIPGSRLAPFASSGGRMSFEPSAETRPVAFPNPVEDHVTVMLGHTNGGIYTVSVLDAVGRSYYAKQHRVPSGQSRLSINMSDTSVPPGLYLLRLEKAGSLGQVLKLIKH